MFSLTTVLGSRWCQRFLYHFIRCYALTFIQRVENEEEWMDYFTNGGLVLLCTWHQQFLPAIRYFKKYQRYEPAIMVSQSADGDIVAGVAKYSGWEPIRGSSSRGGTIAMRMLIAHLKRTRLAAHIMDGPQGPFGKVKPGAVRIAMDAGAVLVPFYISSSHSWFFNSWDRFFVPKPFSRVTITFGDSIHVNPTDSPSEFEAQRQRIETIMAAELRFPLPKT